MGQLEGKVAVVTGASRGQGEAEARLFAAEGACVVVADVLDEDGERVAQSIGEHARYAHLDVRDAGHWARTIDETERSFGPVTVLVNNAAVLGSGGVTDTGPENFMDVVAVNQPRQRRSSWRPTFGSTPFTRARSTLR